MVHAHIVFLHTDIQSIIHSSGLQIQMWICLFLSFEAWYRKRMVAGSKHARILLRARQITLARITDSNPK